MESKPVYKISLTYLQFTGIIACPLRETRA